jgi:hypothetical protein
VSYTALPTKNPGDVLTSALWNTYLQGNADSGFMRMLADSTLVGAQASFDFTSIPATFAHLMLVLFARGDTAASTTPVLMRFNGDTTAQYMFQLMFASATTVGASEGLTQTSIQAGVMPANTAGASEFGECDITIAHYTTANLKASNSRYGLRTASTTGTLITGASSGSWNGSAINRITLLPAAGNFVAGSRATLYGLPA